MLGLKHQSDRRCGVSRNEADSNRQPKHRQAQRYDELYEPEATKRVRSGAHRGKEQGDTAGVAGLVRAGPGGDKAHTAAAADATR